MNRNNLGNNNAAITKQKKLFLREGKLNVLNYFICCPGCLKLTKYRINKKYTCSKSLLNIQQETCQ